MPTARDDDAPSFLPELATQRFTVPIRGAALPCSDNRADAGATLVFLHGAVTDLRLWDRHRALIGRRHRTIACTLRYHGEMASRADWPADWPPYGAQTHADDLIELLDRLGTGPVVLVAWSYAGHVAFQAALQRPGLFRGLFVHEPGVPSYVDDPQSLAAWQPGSLAGRCRDCLRPGVRSGWPGRLARRPAVPDEPSWPWRQHRAAPRDGAGHAP